MLVAQLSDLHIVAPGKKLYRQVDTAAALLRAVARLAAWSPPPDLIVISGDLVNSGRAAEYAHLRQLLAPLPAPVAVLPGNHDDRRELAAAFPEQGFAGELCCRRIEADGLCLLLLDTLVPGAEGGAIGDAQIDWLEANCPERTAAFLFTHHPPFATGIAGMDRIGLAGSERLAAFLDAHRNVIAVASGHVHRTVFGRFAGIPAMIAPSPAHQVALDLAGDAAGLAWTPEPGGMLLHHWDGTRLVSHLSPVEPATLHRYG